MHQFPDDYVKALAYYSERAIHIHYSYGNSFHIYNTAHVSAKPAFQENGEAAVTLYDGTVWITGGFPIEYVNYFVTKTKIIDKNLRISEVQ